MSTHMQTGPHPAPTSRRRRRRVSGRTRALVSLAAVAVLATGLSVKGTFAFWTDSATLQTGAFSSGSLDITLNGALTGPGGTTSLTTPVFALSGMVPGESIAGFFPLANAGTVGLTWTASGTATGTGAPYYTFQLFSGASAGTNTGTAANGNRSGACTGGASLGAPQTLSATSAPLSATARALVASTGTENVCVIALLPTTADNTAQGKTVTASVVFDAKQVGAP
jgi:hypothetical protein